MAEPAPDRPQPVLNAAKLGGLVSAAVVGVGGAIFLIISGVSADNLISVGTAVGVAVTALASLVVYLVSVFQGKAAAEQVTPLSTPQDGRGVQLVPVDSYGRHAARGGAAL